MGQYHIIVNLDKHEFLNPWDMGEGAKLMEWGYGSGTMLTALAILLAVSNGRGGGDYHPEEHKRWAGRWGGDRIAVIGDYAEKRDLPAVHQADLITLACQLARKSKRWVPLEKRLAEIEEQRKEGGGDWTDMMLARERAVEKMPRFKNISAQMRRAIEADGFVRFKNTTMKSRDLDGTVSQHEHITVESVR